MPPILRKTLFMLLTAPALALAAPGFESISPAGGKLGTKFEAKVAGKGLDKGAPQGWCSNPGVKITPGAKAGLWAVEIAKDAAPGPCLVRFHSDDGATPPRIFEVGTLDEVPEAEPNDAFKEVKAAVAARKAVPSMNVTFNGVLAKGGDVDTYALNVQKGRAITLELHGYGLGSPMDPAMRLLDARGVELASSHDTHNLDPLIRHVPAADGVLYAQVFAFVHPPQADVAFQGSTNHVYRLHVTGAPPSSSSSSYSNSSSTPSASATPPGTKSTQPAAAASAAPLTVPFTLRAAITTPGTESTHTLTVKKGDDLRLTVRAKAIHSPLEATLRIESAEGKVLAQNDDGDSITSGNSAAALDPALHWKAPVDGTCRVIIGDRFQNGSADHHYELSVQPWKPAVTAQADTHAYRVEPGKSADLKLTVKFDGTYAEKLRAHAAGLPPGVTAEDVEVPAKGGEVKLTLKAAVDAPPAQTAFAIELAPVPPKTEAKPETRSEDVTSGKEAAPQPPTPAAAAPRTEAATPVLATYPIPFTELRGDLQVVSDAHPWLTVAKGGAGTKPEDKAAK